jgi:hypothetical protein
MRKARESMLTIEAVINLLKQGKLSEADAVCTRILRGEQVEILLHGQPW